MGWGYFVVARKNHGTDHEERRELLYLHKADDIFHAAELRYRPHALNAEGKEDETPEMVMTKKDVCSLRDAICSTPDYWCEYEEPLIDDIKKTGGFKSAETICEIAHAYDEIVEAGWELVFFMG